jgi:hypothetical protein
MVRSCRCIASDLWLGDSVHDVGDVVCVIVVLGSFIVIIGNEKKKGLKRNEWRAAYVVRVRKILYWALSV